MKEPKTVSCIVSSKELVFLAALVNAEELIGIENPYKNFTESGIKTEWEIIRKELSEKGYIKLEEGKIVMDRFIYAAIAICCFCKAIIQAEMYEGRNAVSVHRIYLSQGACIHLYKVPGQKDIYSVRPIVESSELSNIIKQCTIPHYDFRIDNQKARISETQLDNIFKCIKDGSNSGSELLKDSGLSEDAAESLLKALAGSDVHGSLIVKEYKENYGGKATAFKLLKDEDRLWVAEFLYQKGNYIEFFSVSRKQAEDIIDELAEDIAERYILSRNSERKV
ncbi:hypothetical protein DFR58_11971 [Anaerobacterium chartisolvens]|uniref:ESAT-6 protein secretion system EspG family protein n=1 Tax=Anaerobacterium chartisolvens TaxID=1297424 RepID=A0A369AZZ1_9FIRM|nr:hypothetical protein [Anaerobacterium chartisolvens]RCX13014.1 hypothetical protein DFR58_11971 [Anaerobacterium chartisolvens]